MSTFRRRVVVTVDGVKLPEVTTCALDNKGVDIQHADGVDALRPVYNALVRCHVEGTPSSFHRFLETVDEMVDLESAAGDEADDTDPTRPAVSDG
jgi:hypothetical protein